MTALKTLTVAVALLAGAASLAVAQTEWSPDKFTLDKASPPPKANPAPRVPSVHQKSAPKNVHVRATSSR
jgi:hypothetical protein